MPFKIIQGHRFWYQSKALYICDFLLMIITNLHLISHPFKFITDYCSNLRFLQRGIPVLNTVVRGEPRNSGPRNLALKKLILEEFLCGVVLIYRQTTISFCHKAGI